MIVYLIDAVAQAVRAVEVDGRQGFIPLYPLIGPRCDLLEPAALMPSGDNLLVDEDGLGRYDVWFGLPSIRPDQPFAGNGVLIGPQSEEGSPCDYLDPIMSLDALERLVTFPPLDDPAPPGKGVVFAMGPCLGCGRAFTFNPHKVPSVTLRGQREPVCLQCIQAANRIRAARGEPTIQVLPGAYDPMPESEL